MRSEKEIHEKLMRLINKPQTGDTIICIDLLSWVLGYEDCEDFYLLYKEDE